jgi:hypothetical protein
MPEPVPRSQRLRRIRRGVAAGTVAVFVASLAAVVGWGRQPAASPTRAAAPAAPATADPYSGADPYDDGAAQAAPSQTAPADPGPLTSRSS